jgi:lipid A disaccharide synthetase
VEPFPIPEITSADVTPQLLSNLLTELFQETELLKRVREVCKNVKAAMLQGQEGKSPSQSAASEVLEVARRGR